MKIISFILAASLLMANCSGKKSGTSSKSSASTSTKKTAKKAGESDTKAAEPSAPPAPPPPAPAKDMYRAIEEVQMRQTTVSYSKVLMKIMKGEPIEVLEKTTADCWKIKYRDEVGYTNPKVLSEIK